MAINFSGRVNRLHDFYKIFSVYLRLYEAALMRDSTEIRCTNELYWKKDKSPLQQFCAGVHNATVKSKFTATLVPHGSIYCCNRRVH